MNKKFISILVLLFAVAFCAFPQYISSYDTGEYVLYFSSDGKYLSDYNTGEYVYYLSGDNTYISDFDTGEYVFYFNSDFTYLSEYDSGEYAAYFSSDGKYLSDYDSGEYVVYLDSERKYISDYDTGEYIYYANEPLDNVKLCVALIALKIIDKKGVSVKSSNKVKKEKEPKVEKKSKDIGKITGKLEEGSLVAAKWSDGKWYLGSIAKINKTTYDINFADGDKASVTKNDIIPVSKTKFKNGDKVMAVWSDGTLFYDGVIVKTEKDGAVVKWDDGGSESLVEYGKIIKK